MEPNTVEITVPVESLKRRDYGGELGCCSCDGDDKKGEDKGPKFILPEAGDPVDFHVKGTVSRVENGHATVHVAFVNDKRPEAPPAPEDPKTKETRETAKRGSELRGRAKSEGEVY